jgi:hypothetical protein
VFNCSLPLAAMFAGLPPSSSELTERKALFCHLLLQIGGANIENPPPRRRSQRNERLCSVLSVRRRAIPDARRAVSGFRLDDVVLPNRALHQHDPGQDQRATKELHWSRALAEQ